VKPELALAGVVTVPPAPEMMLQDPVPTGGVVAPNVAEVEQTDWSVPALAALGLAVNVMTTSSVDGVHGGLEMVQRKV
jgi:hypothetical protein